MTAQKIDIIIGASPATPATKNLSSPNWKNYNDQIVESYNQIWLESYWSLLASWRPN